MLFFLIFEIWKRHVSQSLLAQIFKLDLLNMYGNTVYEAKAEFVQF